jgi:hypothetical protein
MIAMFFSNFIEILNEIRNDIRGLKDHFGFFRGQLEYRKTDLNLLRRNLITLCLSLKQEIHGEKCRFVKLGNRGLIRDLLDMHSIRKN